MLVLSIDRGLLLRCICFLLMAFIINIHWSAFFVLNLDVDMWCYTVSGLFSSGDSFFIVEVCSLLGSKCIVLAKHFIPYVAFIEDCIVSLRLESGLKVHVS